MNKRFWSPWFIFKAGRPDGSFVSTGACSLERGLEVPSLNAYVNVHYKEPLKSCEKRVRHSPGFRLPSVAILCRKRRKALFTIHVLSLEEEVWKGKKTVIAGSEEDQVRVCSVSHNRRKSSGHYRKSTTNHREDLPICGTDVNLNNDVIAWCRIVTPPITREALAELT